MKKKLLLSVLAAGLVLPSAAALAQDKVTGTTDELKEVLPKVYGELDAKDAEKAKLDAENAANEAKNKALIDAAVATPAEVGNKGNGDVRVSSPDGKVDFTPAVDKTLAGAKPEVKEEGKKPVAPTTNKAANKAGAKKLPKTSAVK